MNKSSTGVIIVISLILSAAQGESIDRAKNVQRKAVFYHDQMFCRHDAKSGPIELVGRCLFEIGTGNE